jgi:hypothetical protein
MAYIDVAQMVRSVSLIEREWAALAKEGIDPPEGWQMEHRWTLAASPGWDAAWASAVAGGMEDPGADPGVITDGMILSAIQGIIEAEKPRIDVMPGTDVGYAHSDTSVVFNPDPITTWGDEQFAIFTDGNFFWDGNSWEVYVAVQLPPQITALEPASASITDPDFEGHIRGLNFTEDSVIIWNGQEEPTRFVDSTDIWTTVVPSVVTAPTVLDVYVRNGDGQVSGIVPFTWEA